MAGSKDPAVFVWGSNDLPGERQLARQKVSRLDSQLSQPQLDVLKIGPRSKVRPPVEGHWTNCSLYVLMTCLGSTVSLFLWLKMRQIVARLSTLESNVTESRAFGAPRINRAQPVGTVFGCPRVRVHILPTHRIERFCSLILPTTLAGSLYGVRSTLPTIETRPSRQPTNDRYVRNRCKLLSQPVLEAGDQISALHVLR